jgi:hypothetical protein
MEATTGVKTKSSIDPVHSEIGFRIKHLVVAISGAYLKNFKEN